MGRRGIDSAQILEVIIRRHFPALYENMEREFRFHPLAGWRFDLAFPAPRVAVEVDGGTWTQGRHTRGAGHASDCEKRNAAQALGWVVLTFPADKVKRNPLGCIEEIENMIEQRRTI